MEECQKIFFLEDDRKKQPIVNSINDNTEEKLTYLLVELLHYLPLYQVLFELPHSISARFLAVSSTLLEESLVWRESERKLITG